MIKRNIEIEVEIDDFQSEEVDTLLRMMSESHEELSSESVVCLVNMLMRQGDMNEIIKLLMIAKGVDELEVHPINSEFGVEFKFQLQNWKFVTKE